MDSPGRTATPVSEIDREQLRVRLERADHLKLVMAGSDFAFRAKHLPGSLHFATPERMFTALKPQEEIVVYCSNVDCHASLATIQKLVERGYGNVMHYAGGLIDWEGAGLPLEGEWGVNGGAK